MQSLKTAVGRVWSNLNPSEPSPMFLVKFMATAAILFLVAYFIGQA